VKVDRTSFFLADQHQAHLLHETEVVRDLPFLILVEALTPDAVTPASHDLLEVLFQECPPQGFQMLVGVLVERL